MSPILMGVMAFIGVASLIGGAFLLFSGEGSTRVEDRLDLLTGTGTSAATAKDSILKDASLLSKLKDEGPNFVERLFERFGNMELLFEQADVTLTVGKLVLVSGALAAAGSGILLMLHVHPGIIPFAAVGLGILPLCWLLFRRKSRMKHFGAQLPDALEMMGRVLRAGQSLGFGFSVVANEMGMPISKEFGRVFEEQNLGVSIDDSLRSLCSRVPNADLKFFTTAVILQRQTGGDLAEILDKIGSLIRERFQIWGQIQALTGEGRLSGVVLLALPFALFILVYQMNPNYVMLLFSDPLGKKMLSVAVVMQILGALVIRKIVNIKV